MTKILASLLVSALALLSACSKPTDAIIPSDVATWDKDLAPQVKKLSQEDQEKAAAYLARARMGEVLGGKGIPIGFTLGQAITAQKQWEVEQAAKRAEEAALKEKLLKEQAATAEALNKAVTVTLVSKSERPVDYSMQRYSQVQAFKIGVRNNSEKALIGVSGELKFIDVFDKEVGAVIFRISEKIKPGGTFVWEGARDYNQFLPEHRAVWNLEEGKYKTTFSPEALIFEDGTSLKVPR